MTYMYTRIRLLYGLCLIALVSFGQPADLAAQAQQGAIAEAAHFEQTINAYNKALYENALRNAALNLTSQGTPAPLIVNPAAIKCSLNADSMGVQCVVTQAHVSTATLADFLPKPPADAVGYPVGGKVPNQSLSVFYDIGKETHYLTESITVAGRTFTYYALSVFNRCWLEAK